MIIAAMRRLASAFVHRSMSPESGTRREMCGVSASGCVSVCLVEGTARRRPHARLQAIVEPRASSFVCFSERNEASPECWIGAAGGEQRPARGGCTAGCAGGAAVQVGRSARWLAAAGPSHPRAGCRRSPLSSHRTGVFIRHTSGRPPWAATRRRALLESTEVDDDTTVESAQS